jgi:hypothetical protein
VSVTVSVGKWADKSILYIVTKSSLAQPATFVPGQAREPD